MQNIPMQTYTEPSGSAVLNQHPPYKDNDDDDDVPGIKKQDVETTFAQNYGLADIYHVCINLSLAFIMKHLCKLE